MNRFASHPAYLNGLPPTGQTTVYVTGDNGTNQTGVPHRYEVLTTGQYSGTTAIVLNGKTDTHSNAVVIDHQYKLMYSRTASASVGASSNGTLPFTTNVNGEGIFTYAAAANTAGLAGYTDWRIATIEELENISDTEAPSAKPDATAFPVWAGTAFYSGSTASTPTTSTYYYDFNSGARLPIAKTSALLTALVRSM